MLIGAEPSNKPINYPLWFVRDLIILVLLAPMLYHVIKKFGKSLIVLFTILWATLRIIHVEIILLTIFRLMQKFTPQLLSVVAGCKG